MLRLSLLLLAMVRSYAAWRVADDLATLAPALGFLTAVQLPGDDAEQESFHLPPSDESSSASSDVAIAESLKRIPQVELPATEASDGSEDEGGSGMTADGWVPGRWGLHSLTRA